MKSICTKCVNFFNKEPDSVRKDVWYNHLCKADPLPTDIDPYDGNRKPFTHNAMGDKCFTEDKYSFCCDINKDGNCNNFNHSGFSHSGDNVISLH
jgi:hypothetical protein